MKKIVLIIMIMMVNHAFGSIAEGQELQAKLNALHTMTADFTQVVKAKQRELTRSSGSMALSRPGHFRWQTKSPMEQLVIADGKQLWVYDVELEQVTVKKQERGVGGTAGLFLSGYNDTVTRDFEVAKANQGSVQIFDLKSKSSKANFQRMKISFSGATLTGLELFDQLGQHTIVQLSHVRNNPQLAAKLFKFTLPKGVDVVTQ